jgi:pimeloyl-ACP methyl ester carboxylesterase
MQRAYLHGFASGPLSKKGQALKAGYAARGEHVHLPDLNVPSFQTLSVRAMLEAIDALDAEQGDEEGWGLVGSSLGGWVAARWAELHPDRVRRLLLLCPAFDVETRWPTLMPAGAMERWRQEGSLLVRDGAGELQPMHYLFYEEACEEPAWPTVPCPTRIVHGRQDDRVPIESSRRYVAEHRGVELVEVDDGHDLSESQSLVVEQALGFLR